LLRFKKLCNRFFYINLSFKNFERTTVLRLKKISRFIIPVLLAIALCSATNATLNKHYHKLPTGVILKHAHPYDKGNFGDPFQKHHHTTLEFIFLEQISNPVFLIGIFMFLFTCIVFSVNETILPFFIALKKSDFYFLRNYHAPPDTTF